MNKCGFTLIELLVAVLIIGILASIALPQYQKAVRRSRFAEIISVSRAVWQAQQLFKLANGEFAPDFDTLGMELPGGWKVVQNDNRVIVNNKSMSMDLSAGGLSTVYWGWGTGNALAYQQYWSGGRRNCLAYAEGGEDARSLCASLGGTTNSSSFPYIYVMN